MAGLGLLLLVAPVAAAAGLVVGLLLFSPAPAAETAACPGVPAHLVLVGYDGPIDPFLGTGKREAKMGLAACGCSNETAGTRPAGEWTYNSSEGWRAGIYVCPSMGKRLSLLFPANSTWSRHDPAVAVTNGTDIQGPLLPAAPDSPRWLVEAANMTTWEAAHNGSAPGEWRL